MKWKLYNFLLHLVESLFFGFNYKSERNKIAKDLENEILNDDLVYRKYPNWHSFYLRYNHRKLIKKF